MAYPQRVNTPKLRKKRFCSCAGRMPCHCVNFCKSWGYFGSSPKSTVLSVDFAEHNVFGGDNPIGPPPLHVSAALGLSRSVGGKKYIFLEPQTTSYKWLFQLDDSQSLHRKWLFHQTSIYKWLFGVPGWSLLLSYRANQRLLTNSWSVSIESLHPNIPDTTINNQPNSTANKHHKHHPN